MPANMAPSLSMSQKVFVTLYRLSSEGRKKVRYEDVVVQVFKDYPADFHLKGYPEYPDSGDAVHKPLYDYRKKGMVSASNKMFSLTPHGLEEAGKLIAFEKGLPTTEPGHHRLERDAEIEINRIKQLESLKLFGEGKEDQIIDADLFDYLGVSVRTSKNDFIGRIEAMKSTITSIQLSRTKDPLLLLIERFHEFMITRFSDDIKFKTAAGRR
jgi:hypothetical protein